jgi:hypothetical protein
MQVLPIDLTALVAITLGCLMILIPIAGLTARYALKPISESIARMREGGASRETISLLERRMALIEQEMQNMTEVRDEVRRLADELEFKRQLGSGERA